MKKIFILSVLTLYFFKPAYAQNDTTRIIFYDAVFLYEHLKINPSSGKPFLPNNDSVKSILRYYFTPENIKDNPFIKPFTPSGLLASEGDNERGNFLKNVVSSVGSLDVTNIADGLARFLVKRGKEELNVAFFQRMKEFLDKNIEAQTLFPATTSFLSNIASYRYAELLQSLREAFNKDLKNLIINLNELIDLPKYKKLLQALPEIRVAIRSAKIVSELSQAESSLHPATLIHQLAYLQEWHEMNLNLENSWKLLDIISRSVRKLNYTVESNTITSYRIDTTRFPEGSFVNDTSLLSNNIYGVKKIPVPNGGAFKITKTAVTSIEQKTVYNNDIAWINFSDFQKKILKDSNALKIFLALLYQKTDSISFRIKKDTVSVQEFMNHHVQDIFAISDLVENFLLLANDVDQTAKELQGKLTAKLTNDDYYSYIDKAINIVEYGFKVANTIKPGIAADRYIVLARNANDLYRNIYTKNYNAAVMNTYLILDEIFTTDSIVLEKRAWYREVMAANSIVKYDSAGFRVNYDSLMAIGFFTDDSLVVRSKTIERILKYGNVMASIVKAESAQEAEAAIEAAVLPVGSSSIKKNTKWNVSLNAYIGGYYSNYTNSTDKINGSNSKIGLTAPIGIAVSKSLQGKRTSSSISAYFTLFDVGAIAGFRLNDDSTALEQKITLENIFTPGAYLVYGLPWNLPISIGVGGQYGSKLYKIESGNLSVSDKSRWRWNIFIGVDIPLLNFATANHRKKSR